jgi:glucokinase
MVSRILHLLVIDMLAVGVAMGRNPGTAGLMSGEADERLDEATPASKRPAARNQAPGVSLASPLAKLTSHSR